MVKPRVKQVKPAGDMTPARPYAAEQRGFHAPATKTTAEACYVKLGVPCVFLCDQNGLRRSKLAGTKLAAVVGVRARSGLVLRCTGGRVSVCTKLLGLPEHGDAFRCELARLWPRLRHGRRQDALGRGGKWS